MEINGKPLKCSIIARDAVYGDPCIVWTVSGLKSEYQYSYYSMDAKKLLFQKLGLLEKKVKVKISGVKINNEMKNFEYEVFIFEAGKKNVAVNH